MIRRENLKLLAAGMVGTGVALRAGPVLAAEAATCLVFDGRFAAARAFAARYRAAHDCGADAASLWFAVLRPQLRPDTAIMGITTAADAMILADCARREGLAFNMPASARRADGLIIWNIS